MIGKEGAARGRDVRRETWVWIDQGMDVGGYEADWPQIGQTRAHLIRALIIAIDSFHP